MYTQWYSDILLRRVSAGHICFSPTLKSFVSLTAEGAIPFNAEEFSDPTELRALVELIGPYGIRLLNETLMWHIGSQVSELKKLVLLNKDILEALRTNFDKPDMMKNLAKESTVRGLVGGIIPWAAHGRHSKTVQLFLHLLRGLPVVAALFRNGG